MIRENYRPERGDYKVDLKLGDCELELFCVSGAPERPSYPEARGLRHLAFQVEEIEKVKMCIRDSLTRTTTPTR